MLYCYAKYNVGKQPPGITQLKIPNGIQYKRASRYAYAIGIINATMMP